MTLDDLRDRYAGWRQIAGRLWPRVRHVALVFVDALDLREGRSFAYCAMSGGMPIVAVHPRLADELTSRQDGILLHELGHAIDYLYGRSGVRAMLPRVPLGAEVRADAIAGAIRGRPIGYDDDEIQSTVARGPRPAHLPV